MLDLGLIQGEARNTIRTVEADQVLIFDSAACHVLNKATACDFSSSGQKAFLRKVAPAQQLDFALGMTFDVEGLFLGQHQYRLDTRQ